VRPPAEANGCLSCFAGAAGRQRQGVAAVAQHTGKNPRESRLSGTGSTLAEPCTDRLYAACRRGLPAAPTPWGAVEKSACFAVAIGYNGSAVINVVGSLCGANRFMSFEWLES